jgi:Putative zinc-finger
MEENRFVASRERDDAMAGLLRRGLRGDAGARTNCPGADILAAYFERSLDANETSRIELHLSGCTHCRAQLAALDRAEEAATPAVQTPPKASRVSWIWDRRWLAPVAAVLVLAAVWVARRPTLTRIIEQPTPAPARAVTSLPTPQPQTAPAPNGARSFKQAAPKVKSGPIDSETRVNPAIVDNSPVPALAVPEGSAGAAARVPPSGRSLVQPDERSKKATLSRQSSRNQAPNATPTGGASESTVESAAPAVSGPAPLQTGEGALGGIRGGAFTAGVGKAAKQERVAAAGYQAQAAMIAATQEQRSASFAVPTPDKNILWHILQFGFVERSEDGGATWHGTLPKQNAHYTAGSAPTAKVCWLVGNKGLILLTPDASNWQIIPPPVQADFVRVAALDAWTATVTAADGRKFTTTDQGESWVTAK